ncbi:hypothetical protein BJ085DRAFT_28184 [Dimargaris cristalligena]|uniref:PH domain-containing protein n=1 Tax=Dimargaris cristalligena TaxID=215637 RepID=A0A4P9ZMJ1_9FUNG|nr:hypothetical protein BJ085DRAFT_28184 [Dimargaris cristalligena]|eukprot:RKP34433.1 hypothetical protein BJ085DRAFT_28184 [Dimargaris cristalligena]
MASGNIALPTHVTFRDVPPLPTEGDAPPFISDGAVDPVIATTSLEYHSSTSLSAAPNLSLDNQLIWKKGDLVKRSGKLKEYELMGMINLKDIRIVSEVTKRLRPNTIGIITLNKIYYLQADNVALMNDWIHALTLASQHARGQPIPTTAVAPSLLPRHSSNSIASARLASPNAGYSMTNSALGSPASPLRPQPPNSLPLPRLTITTGQRNIVSASPASAPHDRNPDAPQFPTSVGTRHWPLPTTAIATTSNSLTGLALEPLIEEDRELIGDDANPGLTAGPDVTITVINGDISGLDGGASAGSDRGMGGDGDIDIIVEDSGGESSDEDELSITVYDPSFQEAFNSAEIFHRGYLLKRDKYKQWRKRWFVLRMRSLSYYKNNKWALAQNDPGAFK